MRVDRLVVNACCFVFVSLLSCSDVPEFPDASVGSVRQAIEGGGIEVCTQFGYTSIIEGTPNNDVLQGTAGPDCILGYGGDDQLNGLAGDDILLGGDGNDVLQGGDGADQLAGEAGNDTHEGGNDNDVSEGGAGDDIFTSVGGDDRFYGGLGNDRITGGPGADTIWGGHGANRLEGGAGADAIIGGSCHDLIVSDAADLEANGFGGFDACDVEGCDVSLSLMTACTADSQCDQGDRCVLATGHCIPKFEPFCDRPLPPELEDTACPPGLNVIEGTEGDDELEGTPGNDCIVGKGGNDTLRGFGGDDVLKGGDGTDWLDGGEGDDTLEGGNGHDGAEGGRGDDTFTDVFGDDVFYGSSGNDHIEAGPGDDLVIGEEGADFIDGGDGADRLFGDGCHDRVLSDEVDLEVEGSSGFDACDGNGCELSVASITECTEDTNCPSGQRCAFGAGHCIPQDEHVCERLLASDADCTDGTDNDDDGLTDCADLDDCGDHSPCRVDEGQPCTRDYSCDPGLACIRGACQRTHCANGIKDADEVGTDCGGPCQPCTGDQCDNVCTLGQPTTPPALDTLEFWDGSFTRGTTATYMTEEGVLETAREDELRWTAVSGLRMALFEGAGTNLLSWSSAMDHQPDWDASESPMTVVSDAHVAPDGSLTAELLDTIEDPARGPRQQVTVAAADMTYSVFARSALGNAPVRDRGQARMFAIDADAPPGSLALAGRGFALPAQWKRFDLSATPTLTTNVSFLFSQEWGWPSEFVHGIQPQGIEWGPGYDFHAWGAQLEAQPFPTSYIPTQGFPEPRDADSLVVDVPWWITTGTWQVDVAPLYGSAEMRPGASYTLFSLGAQRDIALVNATGGTTARIVLRHDGGTFSSPELSWARGDILQITFDLAGDKPDYSAVGKHSDPACNHARCPGHHLLVQPRPAAPRRGFIVSRHSKQSDSGPKRSV